MPCFASRFRQEEATERHCRSTCTLGGVSLTLGPRCVSEHETQPPVGPDCSLWMLEDGLTRALLRGLWLV